jgi:hypothetical protein
MQPEGLLPYSQEPSNGLYPEPDYLVHTRQSCLSEIHFNIIHPPQPLLHMGQLNSRQQFWTEHRVKPLLKWWAPNSNMNLHCQFLYVVDTLCFSRREWCLIGTQYTFGKGFYVRYSHDSCEDYCSMAVTLVQIVQKDTTESLYLLHMAPCSTCINQGFGGKYRIHLQGAKPAEQETSLIAGGPHSTTSRQMTHYCSRYRLHTPSLFTTGPNEC